MILHYKLAFLYNEICEGGKMGCTNLVFDLKLTKKNNLDLFVYCKTIIICLVCLPGHLDGTLLDEEVDFL